MFTENDPPGRRRFAQLLSYVKLARMRGADLVSEPPRKHQDNHEGNYVHELCNHEHHIVDHDRMTVTSADDNTHSA